MEQETFSIKILTRRQDTQAELTRKRELLDHITDRLKDLEEMDARANDDDTDSENDDILNDIIPTPSESLTSRSTGAATEGTAEDEEVDENREDGPASAPTLGAREPQRIVETLDQVISEKPETITSQHLRPRGKTPLEPSDPEKQGQDDDTAQTTGASRSLLFGNRSKEVSEVATSEAILDHQRKEQEAVTEDLLRMASQLKLSSQKFGEALQEDTEVLGHAAKGLGKNELSLESAARRMGAITRMTEGKGWYGRIMLYAWIYGLMVVMVLVVFVLPKLRF